MKLRLIAIALVTVGCFEARSQTNTEKMEFDVASVEFHPDQSGPLFVEALKGQLGLKLESTKGRVKAFVVDHVERPSEN